MGNPGIKGWLTANKVFFETAAAALLSFMAVVVALAQLWISYSQSDFLKLQTLIAEAGVLPDFATYQTPIFSADGKANEYDLSLENLGGSARELSSTAAVFLEIDFGSAETNSTTTVRVCLEDYYGASFVSPSLRGHLLTYRGTAGNNAKVFTLDKELRQKADEAGMAYANLTQKVYVRLAYRDVLERPHEEFFVVPAVGVGQHLASSDGERVFQAWGGGGRRQALGTLTADRLFAYATARMKDTSERGQSCEIIGEPTP